MIVGVALFGIFAGITYWFPKIFGFKLDERLGKRAFWFWFIGFFVAFIPLYLLGFMGATRRLDHYACIDRLAAVIHHCSDWICYYLMRSRHPNLSGHRQHQRIENSIWIRLEILGMEGHWNGRPLPLRLSIILP